MRVAKPKADAAKGDVTIGVYLADLAVECKGCHICSPVLAVLGRWWLLKCFQADDFAYLIYPAQIAVLGGFPILATDFIATVHAYLAIV
jgi:hypothetical protein